MIPKFLISNPRVLLASTTLPDGELDSYYNDPASKRSWHPPAAEVKSDAMTEAHGDPFSDPAQHPNDVALIRRVHSPDSERSSSRASRRDTSSRTLSLVAGDDAELREVSLTLGIPRWPFDVGEAEAEELAEQVSPAPTHREGERMELPQTPPSARRYY